MRWTEQEYARHLAGENADELPADRQKPRDLEHQEAVALMEWKRTQLANHPDLKFLYAIPNGGDRNPIVAARIAAEGTVAGVSDYHLPVARGGHIGLYLELKEPKGRPSQDQLDWLDAVRSKGHAGVVAYGWVQAAAFLLWYLELPPSVVTDPRALTTD